MLRSIAISPKPSDVTSVYGDPSRARNMLGWQAKRRLEDAAHNRIMADLEVSRKNSSD